MGLLIIDKPLGWTSQDVVNKIRRIYKTKQVGHTGTLDPLASGVLVILIGNTCKLSDYFVKGEKEYIASITLGIQTPTLDLESPIIKEENPLINKEEIIKACNSFLGESEQIPPLTSAIKVNGIPLYDFAHKGLDYSVPKRKINIYDIKILDYSNEDIKAPKLENSNRNINIKPINLQYTHTTVKVQIKCSHGTYIRAIARDLGARLNTLGTLTGLERISNNNFNINECIQLEDIINSPTPENFLIDDKVLKNIFPYENLNDDEFKSISFGQFIPKERENIELPLLLFNNDEFIGIGRIKDNLLKPKRLFAIQSRDNKLQISNDK